MAHKSFTCRFCLANEGQGVDLFDHYVSDRKICLGLVASQLFDLKISKEDGIPGEICIQCFLKTCDYYYFKLKCQRSDHTLKESHSKRKLEVKQHSISNSYISEIHEQVAGFKGSPERLTGKRKVDREETCISTKRLNSSEESIGDNSQGASSQKSAECRSCLQYFPSSDLIDHVLQHLKLEKCAEIEANKSHVENIGKDIDWTFEKVNATLALKCDVVKTEVCEISGNPEWREMKRENDDCTVVYVGGLTDSKGIRVGEERDASLHLVEVRRDTNECFPENEKSISRKTLSFDEMKGLDSETRIGNERNCMESSAEVQCNVAKETFKYSQQKVDNMKSVWLSVSPAERNCYNPRREQNLNNTLKSKPACISKLQNKFANIKNNMTKDKRTERDVFQQINPLCTKADLRDEIECMNCFSNDENTVLDPNCGAIERDITPNFNYTNGECEGYDLVMRHSNDSTEKRDTSRCFASSLDSLSNKNIDDSEDNVSIERSIEQEFHQEEKSLTSTSNFIQNCGFNFPYSFRCSLCQDSFSSHDHLLKHLLVHKKYGTLGARISLKQKKEKEKHEQSFSEVNEIFGKDRTVERRTKAPSSELSHSKTFVCASKRGNPSKSLLTGSLKKQSLQLSAIKSNCGPSESDLLVSDKKDSNLKKFDCWLCVKTFPTARLLLDHSYIHFQCSETIYSSNHSDVNADGYSPLQFTFNKKSEIIDRKLVEGEKLLQKKLQINDLNGKSFRCPACLNKFSEWSTTVQHIVKCHENLSEEWPMKILFLPQLKNPLINAKNSGKNEADPLCIMRSLLCGLRCEFCYKPFHSQKALLKHKVWAHPDNIGV